MTAKVPLESEVRCLRREGVPPELRHRVLAAAEIAARSTPAGAPISSRTSWRFAAVVASLAIPVFAGLWYVTASRPPARESEAPVAVRAGAGAGPASASPQAVPDAGARRRSSRPVRPPGDDTVVFWVDDDTPVFVNLLEAK